MGGWLAKLYFGNSEWSLNEAVAKQGSTYIPKSTFQDFKNNILRTALLGGKFRNFLTKRESILNGSRSGFPHFGIGNPYHQFYRSSLS